MMMTTAAYQELVDALRDLPLRTCDCDFVAGLFCAWKHNLAVPFLLQCFDLGKTSEKLPMIKTIDVDDLGGELGILVEIISPATLATTSGVGCTNGAVNHLQNL
jgi:hypothetical protein